MIREPAPIPKHVKTIFGVLLLLMGLASALGGGQIQKIKDAYASRAWPSIEGKVIASQVESKTGRSHSGGRNIASTSYFAKVVYEYAVGGKKYSSDRISFGDYGNSNRQRVADIISRYPADQRVEVFYSPTDPGKSVLEPGAPPSTFVPLGIGILMLAIGGKLLYSATTK